MTTGITDGTRSAAHVAKQQQGDHQAHRPISSEAQPRALKVLLHLALENYRDFDLFFLSVRSKIKSYTTS